MAKLYLPYNAASSMLGPFPLDTPMVIRVAPRATGIYLLGNRGFIEYVGRSLNLETRLLAHVATGYSQFYFRERDSEVAAYLWEGIEFHRYGSELHLDNLMHPARPSKNSPACVVCNS